MTHRHPTQFLVILAFSLAAALPAPRSFADSPTNPDISTLATANNTFATDLYSQLTKTQSGNLFFSPYSITTALAMTANGAVGPTADQITRTLHLTLDPRRTNSAFASLAAQLTANQNLNELTTSANPAETQHYSLTLANALWTQTGFPINPAFLHTLQSDFSAAVNQSDFQNNPTESANDINNWVANQTKDKIKNLVSPSALPKNTRLVLVNAIYFQGNWLTPFDPARTHDAPFYLSSYTIPAPPQTTVDNSPVPTVPMMNQIESHPYLQTDDLQLAEFPYQGNTLTMTILLPKSPAGLPALESSLTPAHLTKLLAKAAPTELIVYLPKFQLTSQFELSDTLDKMGMPLPFSKDADFSNISIAAPLQISKVIHKAYVDVDELGTKAAAATAITMVTSAAPLTAPPPIFRADHPFLFLIRDKTSGAILFMGRFTNPSQN